MDPAIAERRGRTTASCREVKMFGIIVSLTKVLLCFDNILSSNVYGIAYIVLYYRTGSTLVSVVVKLDSICPCVVESNFTEIV